MTRRGLLLGGGAALAGLAVAAGSAAVGRRSWTVRDAWYRFSGAYGEAGTPPPAYRVTYGYGVVPSGHVAENAVYGIAYPPALAAATPGARSDVPVCICLPGRGRSPRELLQGHLRLGDFLADAIEKGAAPPFALAAVQAGETYWHRRRTGDDAMAMLFDDFIPLLRRDLGLGGPLGLLGWSMGGYGALRAAELHPVSFAGVCAVSAALWRSYDDGVGDAFDDAADYAANDVFGDVGRLSGLPVCIDCGRQDPFYNADRAFAAALPDPPQGGFEVGGHNDAYWSRVAPAELEFIGAALSRASRT